VVPLEIVMMRLTLLAFAGLGAANAAVEQELRPRQPKALVQADSKISVVRSAASGNNALVSGLRAEIATASRAQKRLRYKLDAVSDIAHEDIAHLSKNLKSAEQSVLRTEETLRQQLSEKSTDLAQVSKVIAQKTASEKSLRSQLAVVQQQLQQETRVAITAEANATKVRQDVEANVAAARGEKMGLLEQISGMSQQLVDDKKKGAKVEQEAIAERHGQENMLAKQNDEMRQREAKQRRELVALQEEADRTHANLTSESAAKAATNKEVDSLRQIVAKQQNEIQAAVADTDDLRSSEDAVVKEAAALRQKDDKADTDLKDVHEKLGSSQQEVKELRELVASKGTQMAQMQHQSQTLESQVSSLNATTASLAAKSKAELRNAMLSAAEKVHDLEDETDQLTSKVGTDDSALKTARAENDQLQTDLQKEEQAKRDASAQAAAAQSTIAAVNKSIAEDTSKAAALSAESSRLFSDRARLVESLSEKAAEAGKYESMAQDSESAATDSAAKVKKLEHDNAALQAQATSLSGDAERAEAVASELQALQNAVSHNSSRVSDLEEQAQRLRGLKDEYSQQYEDAETESKNWKEKAIDSQAKLAKATADAKQLGEQRGEEARRVKEARSQEDEYFEEQTRLQQQIEALSSQLAQAESSSNESAAHEHELRTELGEEKADEARESRNSHAAWVTNQKELLQARVDVKDAVSTKDEVQAELMRTRAVLTADQSKVLGLSTPGATVQPMAASAATPGATVQPMAASAAVKTGTKFDTLARTLKVKLQLDSPKALGAIPRLPVPQTGHQHHLRAGAQAAVPAAASGSALQQLAAFFAAKH